MDSFNHFPRHFVDCVILPFSKALLWEKYNEPMRNLLRSTFRFQDTPYIPCVYSTDFYEVSMTYQNVTTVLLCIKQGDQNDQNAELFRYVRH